MERYYVLDRGANQATELHHFSYTNPRYLIIDRETNKPVDEMTTKKFAVETARDMNREEAK